MTLKPRRKSLKIQIAILQARRDERGHRSLKPERIGSFDRELIVRRRAEGLHVIARAAANRF